MKNEYIPIGLMILFSFIGDQAIKIDSLREQSIITVNLLREQLIVSNRSINKLSNMYIERQTHVFKYTSPIKDYDKLTSPFGYRELLNPYTGGTRSSNHKGLDIVGAWHSEIRSIDLNGEVIDVWMPPDDYYRGHDLFGGFVRIRHNDDWISGYTHLSSIYVREDDLLIDGIFYRKGKVIGSIDVIGRQGDTGISTGEHLHLLVEKPDGTFVDPLRWIEL